MNKKEITDLLDETCSHLKKAIKPLKKAVKLSKGVDRVNKPLSEIETALLNCGFELMDMAEDLLVKMNVL